MSRKNKDANFNGSVDHSLSLRGQHSFAKKNVSCATFLGHFETMFSFFAASIHRYEVLNWTHWDVSETDSRWKRWSDHRAATVKSVNETFDECVASIDAL